MRKKSFLCAAGCVFLLSGCSFLSNYQKNLGTKVATNVSYRYFSGAVSVTYSSSTYESTANQYATIQTEMEGSMYLNC